MLPPCGAGPIWSDLNMTKPIKISNVPRYGEIIENGIGHYFANQPVCLAHGWPMNKDLGKGGRRQVL